MEVTRADYIVVRENTSHSVADIIFKGHVVDIIPASDAEKWIERDIKNRNT